MIRLFISLTFLFGVYTNSYAKALTCAQLFPIKTTQAPAHPAIIDKIVKSDFKTWRNFNSYALTFGSAFSNHLDRLGAKNAWIDFGSGDGLALTEFLQSRTLNVPDVYGLTFHRPYISVEDPRPLVKAFKEFLFQKKFIRIEGRFIEDIPNSELPMYDVATDFFGPLAYTNNISLVLNKYLATMRSHESSALYTLQLFFDINSLTSNGSTYIITREGKAISLPEWLKRQPGIIVESVPTDIHAMVVKKQKADVQVPHLELLYMNEKAPPIRIFREPGATADQNTAIILDPRDQKIKTLPEALKKVFF